MRFLFVVRFKDRTNGPNSVKAFRTTAKSSKAAAQKMRKKGQILSVRKVKRVAP